MAPAPGRGRRHFLSMGTHPEHSATTNPHPVFVMFQLMLSRFHVAWRSHFSLLTFIHSANPFNDLLWLLYPYCRILVVPARCVAFSFFVTYTHSFCQSIYLMAYCGYCIPTVAFSSFLHHDTSQPALPLNYSLLILTWSPSHINGLLQWICEVLVPGCEACALNGCARRSRAEPAAVACGLGTTKTATAVIALAVPAVELPSIMAVNRSVSHTGMKIRDLRVTRVGSMKRDHSFCPNT
jgi:hypothetical protein